MNWINQIIEQHKEYESPSAFWYWAALVTISAVIRDNVWWDKYLYKVYPNIYVMLHADSGLRKGPPVSMAKQLVTAVNNTTIISGRSSIQGILAELGRAQTEPGGKIKSSTSAFICANELSSSLVDDPAAMDILTDLYDRSYNSEEYASLLKQEKFNITRPTVCMLTATNQAHSEQFFEGKDIKGGYFARTFIIHESTPNTINSLMYPPEVKTDYPAMVPYLKEIAKLKGEFQISPVIKKYFDEWYQDFKKSLLQLEVKDSTGTLNRFDDSVIKVSMLLSLGKEPSLVMQLATVQEAIQRCEKLIGNVRKATHGKGKNAFAQQKSSLIIELVTRPGHMISRKMLNKKRWAEADSDEWDQVCKDLATAGIIQIDNVGNEIIYRMPDKQVDEMKKYFEGKNK